MSEHKTPRPRPTLWTRLTGKLYLLPFLLVCVVFVLLGTGELVPEAGAFGVAWAVAALAVVVAAVIALVRKEAFGQPVGEASDQSADGHSAGELSVRSASDTSDSSTATNAPPLADNLSTDGQDNPSADGLSLDSLSDDPLSPENLLMADVDRILRDSAAQSAAQDQIAQLSALHELHYLTDEEYLARRRKLKDHTAEEAHA